MKDTEDTIQKLKELDLFTTFKFAMEVIVKETNKPQWDVGVLTKYGLVYNDQASIDYYYEEYLDNLKNVRSASKYIRGIICNHKQYHVYGLTFGSIRWALTKDIFQDCKHVESASKISYECFYGMTASQILQVLVEHIKIEEK